MALDFPASPVNGQIYDNFYYDSTMGTWRAQGSGLALNAFVSPTITGATITGGTVSGLATDLSVSDGGTGNSTFSDNVYLKGNGVLPIIGQSGIPAADITSGQISAARMPTGSVVQVVQTNFVTRSSQSYSNATVTDISGLSASITPKSTSSRIMAFVRWFGEFSPNDAPYNTVFGLKRNGTRIGEGTDNGSTVVTAISAPALSYEGADSSSTVETMSFFYLDSPATTSAITYQVFFISNVGAGSGVIAHNKAYNWSGQSAGFELGTSNITLMEIA